MVDIGQEQGRIGGVETSSTLAIFNPIVMRDPFQATMERDLQLARKVPVDQLSSRAYRWAISQPDILDAGLLYPPRVEPGAEFPLVGVSGGEFSEGHISGGGYRAEFDVDAQNDPGRLNRTRNGMLNWAADYFEKKSFELITGATLDWTAMTTSSTWADNAEFDDFLGTRLDGGYSDGSVGETNTLLFGNNDGYYWDSPDGNPVMDLMRVISVLQDQNRAAGSNALEGQMVTVPWNTARTRMIMDSTSYGALFAYLMNDNKYNPLVSPSGSQMTVPQLFGITFERANRALPIDMIDIAGNGSGYGISIIYDESEVPFRGYQYFPGQWTGWSRGGTVQGSWDYMGYAERLYDIRGLYQVGFWTSIGIAVEVPRKLAIYGGMRSKEGF